MVTKKNIEKVIAEIDVLIAELYDIKKEKDVYEMDNAISDLQTSKDWLMDIVMD